MNEEDLGSCTSENDAPRPWNRPFVPHDILIDKRRPVPLSKFQMAPVLRFIMSSGSKKKEPRCACLSEAKGSHAHNMWTEVSSSVPHFLKMGLLLNPITYKCLLMLLCPVRRPIITLDCVLLKESNRVFVVRIGPEINSRACLCVLQGPCHNTKCWLSIQLFIFLLIFCLETPKDGSSPTNIWTEPFLKSLWTIPFPLNPACPGTQYRPTMCQVEISFKTFWQCRTKGDVRLIAWSAYRSAWLLQQISLLLLSVTFMNAG